MAAAVAVAAADPASRPLSPEFWQLLLTAELPFVRREALIRRARALPPSTDWARFFAQAPELSPADRARAAKAELPSVHKALQEAELVEKEALPERFRDLMGTPHALFFAGMRRGLEGPAIGIVGTRGASVYGKAVARKFAEAFARAGVCVVSGGAQGIDAAAHDGALFGGGTTCAVLACGIDRTYPAANRGLFERIRANGCLTSQFPAGWNPRMESFVQRNATIAALSQAVLVVEAPEQSGALITANRANEFGRPVFVVPGNISTLSFRGSHALIRDGATLVDHPDQVLADLSIPLARKVETKTAATSGQRRILDALGADPLAVDQIAERCRLDPATVLSELTMLELESKVLRGPGGYVLAP